MIAAAFRDRTNQVINFVSRIMLYYYTFSRKAAFYSFCIIPDNISLIKLANKKSWNVIGVSHVDFLTDVP